MIMDALPHGGDLGLARSLFPDAPEPFIDLSTGINPHSYPLPQLHPEFFQRLPEPAALASLAAVAAAAYGAPAADHIVPAPGTQMLLVPVAALLRPGRAAVLGPTYAEHARAAALAGHQVSEVGTLDALADADLAIVVNPNNPDGRLFSADALLNMAVARRRRRVADESGDADRGRANRKGKDHRKGVRDKARCGGLLVIDEAFMDAIPAGVSLAGAVADGDIVVLRSFGKFYGLAGLRVGFAIAAPPLARRLAAALGPWAVGGPAIAIATAALADTAWAAAMCERLSADSARLDGALAGAGLVVAGGVPLFRLVQSPRAGDLFRHLGRAGILVRRFTEQPTWLRFGLPRSEVAWTRLTAALAAFAKRRDR
jgi:cobalamin biosynthetic protein CobC